MFQIVNINFFYSFALSEAKKDYIDHQLSPREINYSETRTLATRRRTPIQDKT